MLKISAQINNRQGQNNITLTTNNNQHTIDIPPRSTGFGSAANGGELLFLALATCYCNDIYREAAKRNIVVRSVQVEVTGEFGEAPGSPAENIHYNASVEAEADENQISDLMRHTDTVAEIQNTLRRTTAVSLGEIKTISIR